MPHNIGWQNGALCSRSDPAPFYPAQGGSSVEAKKICRECTVRTECLEHAMASNERYGVWGGLTDPERQELKRKRNSA